MTLVRDDPDFDRMLGAAADKLRITDPTFVEKDYWVTQTLRMLNAEFPGGFVFKGGTSLSKGYSIIQRFSEDVDVLVVPIAGYNNRQHAEHLANMTDRVSAALGLKWREVKKPGSGRLAHRGDEIAYPTVLAQPFSFQTRPSAVLLETGYSDGHEPAEMVTITPLLCSAGIVDAADFDDTAGFMVRALLPMRTLIEKLFALHHVASQYVKGVDVSDIRFGRHYYDVHQLLDHGATLKGLDNSVRFGDLVEEVQRISQAQFGGTTARPDGGFAESPAFAADSEQRGWLQEQYEASLELVPGGLTRPKFSTVLNRVQQNARRL